MVSQQFTAVLAKYGCRPIQTAGKPFDPNVHQAISQMASEQPAGAIANEVAVGYMLHDRVVRPSCVIVSTGPQAT
jgi:molecular chaperone GrpE